MQKNESTFYTACGHNCGSGQQCVLKGHLKDGALVGVEPDDRYNPGIGREDAILSDDDLLKERLQRRPCPKMLVYQLGSSLPFY